MKKRQSSWHRLVGALCLIYVKLPCFISVDFVHLTKLVVPSLLLCYSLVVVLPSQMSGSYSMPRWYDPSQSCRFIVMRSIAQLSCHSTLQITRPQSDAIRRIDRHLAPAKDQEGSLVRVGHWTMVSAVVPFVDNPSTCVK